MDATITREDELLNEAGLTRSDFIALRSVFKSEFSGRIIVEVWGTISGQPIEQREVLNLFATHYDTSITRYIFNPVA